MTACAVEGQAQEGGAERLDRVVDDLQAVGDEIRDVGIGPIDRLAKKGGGDEV